jgi:N-acetylneuraminic acid mutarotase
MLTTRAVCLLAVLALAACGGGSGGSGGATPPAVTPPPVSVASVLVEGAVQKGPFIVGSTVLINRLDNRGQSTPSTLVAEIEDSVGSFSFKTDELGPVQIVAMGYYFSELTGQISDGVLTLRALYEVNDDTRQTAHVNILTHLINDRVLELIADGQPTLREAIAQAEDELVVALSDALVIPDLNEFSSLSLYDLATSQNNTLGNAYLLALSTGFYKYAKTKAQEFGTATDAELTLALNRISDDLADDGRLRSGPFIEEFVTAIRSLSPETIAANLRSRSLVDYPQGLGVPDISVFLSLCAGNFDCPWGAGAAMPITLSTHATAVHAGKIYVFGGSTQNGPYDNDEVNAYDPLANEWTPKQRMPVRSRAVTAHTIGDTIYVVVGTDHFMQLQNTLYAYDPIADQWSSRATRPTYRTNFVSAAVNGLLYVIGGVGQVANGPGYAHPNEHKSHVELYNPATDQWSTRSPLPTALTESRACVVGDEIYVFGGWTLAGPERSILTYNTLSNSWTAKSPMQTTRSSAFDCVTLDGTVYLVGGTALDHAIDGTIDRYDPFVETWASPIRMPTPRSFLSATVVGRRVFTIGGLAQDTSVRPVTVRTVDVVEILDVDRL